MRKEDLWGWIRGAVVEVREGLSADEIRSGASFFNDLGFDSLGFESLVTKIKCDVVDVDLTPWYIRASTSGEDTIDSLVAFLSDRLDKARISVRFALKERA